MFADRVFLIRVHIMCVRVYAAKGDDCVII